MALASAKVPAAIVSGVICLLLGVAGGVVLGGLTNTPLNPAPAPSGEEAAKDDTKTPGKGDGAKDAGAKGGGKGGGAKGGGKGGGAPPPKAQLVLIVAKIELLTRTPPLKLTAEEKKQLKAVLADIDAKDDLSDDEARGRVEAILKAVEEHKVTVEASGFRWPGSMPPPAGNTPPNPFKSGPASEDVIRLKALRAVLDAP